MSAILIGLRKMFILNHHKIFGHLRIIFLCLLFLLDGLIISCRQLDPYGWMESASVESLTQALTDTDERMRVEAAYELSRRGTDASPAVPALMNALKDPSPDVQCAAIRALANIGAPAAVAVPTLESLLLTSPSDQVAGMSAGALARIGTSSSLPILRQAVLTSEDLGVRRASLQALVALGGAPQNIDIFIFFLENESDHVMRQRAVEGLSIAGDEAGCAIPLLATQLNDTDLLFRQASARAIAEITGEPFQDTGLTEQGESQVVIDAREWWETSGQYTEWPPCP